MANADDLIDEREAAFLAAIIDEDRAAASLEALYTYMSRNNVRLSAAQEARLDYIQEQFRSGPGRFKSELH